MLLGLGTLFELSYNMQFPHIELELVSSDSAPCVYCSEPLTGTSVVVDHISDAGRWIRRAAHPSCYKPNVPMPIQCVEKVTPEIEGLVGKWNQEFELEDYQEKFHIVETPVVTLEFGWATTKRRCWLEILKFFAAEEVARGLGVVCHELYLYSWDTELWNPAPGDLGSPDVGRRRACYISSKLRRCVSCYETRPCRLIRCPILKKPICIVCRENPCLRGNKKYALRPVASLLKKYGINRSVLDLMKVPIVYDRRKRARAYDFMVEQAVEKYSPKTYGHSMITRHKGKSSSSSSCL